jgi:CDP-paratose 2-epimerase
MRILITGVAGFVGSQLALALRDLEPGWEIIGLDNFIRPGSETNRLALKQAGVSIRHADIRLASDFEGLPAADFLIDAAANPSVLAGVDGQTSTRQLVEHNLIGTVNMLEWCKQQSAGFVLLSTSRVYSIPPLAGVPVVSVGDRYEPDAAGGQLPAGLSLEGVDETFPTAAPVSLYGATKIASEVMALEYGATFDLPVWVNRCGVMAGAGQFGRPDQGIVAFWLNAHLRRRPMKYIGFNGLGHQVRDCLHPADLAALVRLQLKEPVKTDKPRLLNVGGGRSHAFSLNELTQWADKVFGAHPVATEPQPRPFDIPWLLMDSRQAREIWGWEPKISREAIFVEIANHARENPDWLELSKAN